MKMNLEEMIIKTHPKLEKKYKSEQYMLSREIISIKVTENKTQRQMAKDMGLTYKRYLKMEYSDITISVEDYQQALNKVRG